MQIEITMENGAVMKGELYPEIAPITVENFKKLADEHFFDGLIFHRVIAGFMIQGGGYDKNGNHKDCDSIRGEFESNGIQNDLKHDRGVLSMAHRGKNTGGSQFFICHNRENTQHLDGVHTCFGKVVEGLDVIDKIRQGDKILSITIVEE